MPSADEIREIIREELDKDRLWLGELVRGGVWAVADGRLGAVIRQGAPDGWRAPANLQDILGAITTIPGDGGGLSEAQIEAIAQRVLKKIQAKWSS